MSSNCIHRLKHPNAISGNALPFVPLLRIPYQANPYFQSEYKQIKKIQCAVANVPKIYMVESKMNEEIVEGVCCAASWL